MLGAMITAGKSASPSLERRPPSRSKALRSPLAEDLLHRPNHPTGAFDVFWGSLDLDQTIEVKVKNTSGADGFD